MRLELDDRFVELRQINRTFVVREGKIGTPGTERVEQFWFQARASAAYRRELAKKQAEGFREGKQLVVLPEGKREPALEAAIRADREDPAGYDVYADWLQQHGEPHGELIALQRGFDNADNRRRCDEIIDAMRINDDLVQAEWRWGFWSSLAIGAKWGTEPGDDRLDVRALARHAFSQRSCVVLRELRVGELRWDSNHTDIPVLIGEAVVYPWAADLEALALGDVVEDIDMAHHVIGRVGVAISRSFPRLHTLHLHSGSDADHGDGRVFGIEGLDLPELQELTIETCSFSRVHLAQLFAANLPKLTKLELWFGSDLYGSDVELSDLAPLLANKVFPNLTDLGICNARFADALARMIHTTAIAPQLHKVDLSKGTLDDAAALELVARADAFESLHELDVDDSFLTPAGVHALKQRFPTVHSSEQRQPRANGERYVSVSE